MDITLIRFCPKIDVKPILLFLVSEAELSRKFATVLTPETEVGLPDPVLVPARTKLQVCTQTTCEQLL